MNGKKIFSRKLRKYLVVPKKERINISKRSRNIFRKWKFSEENLILEYFRKVIQEGLELEKPTADVFYAKLIDDLQLVDVTPGQAKNKVRHLKDSYIRALKWKDEAEQNDEVRSWNPKICRHFDILSEVYGNSLTRIPKPSTYHENEEPEEEEEHGKESCNYENVEYEPHRVPSPMPQYDITVKSEEPCESLQCLKEFLSVTSEAINRAFPTTSCEPDEQRNFTSSKEDHCLIEAKWKMGELKLQEERLELEKLKHQWEREMKEKELELRNKEIETNARLRVLEIEKEERIEKFKIEHECKLQLELASIQKSNEL